MAYSILIDKYIFLLFFTHIGSLNRIFTCINNIGYIDYLKCQYWLILCKTWRCHVFSLTRILEALRFSFLLIFRGNSSGPTLHSSFSIMTIRCQHAGNIAENHRCKLCEKRIKKQQFLKFWGSFVLPMTKIEHVHHGKIKGEERRSSWFARVVPDSRKYVHLANCCTSSDL